MNKLILIFLLVCNSVYANIGGDEGLNGGGIAEQNIILGWMMTRQSLLVCERLSDCSGSEFSSLYQDIRTNLYHEVVDGQLIFVNGSERPDLFPISENQKIYSSTKKLGGKFFINKEKIYQDSNPISLFEALSTLLEAELTHYTASDEIKEKFHNEVIKISKGKWIEKSLVNYSQPHIRFLTWKLANEKNQIFLSDFKQNIEITDDIQKQISCPSELKLKKGFSIENPRWQEPLSWDPVSHSQWMGVVTEIYYNCQAPDHNLRLQATLTILVSFDVLKDGLKIDEKDWYLRDDVFLQMNRQNRSVLITNKSEGQ